MDFNPIVFSGGVILGIILTFIILHLTLRLNKRKPPNAVIMDSFKWLAMRIRPKKYVFNLEDYPQIKFYDWDRGLGYGYLSFEDRPKIGDAITTPYKNNKRLYLIVYKLDVPDPKIPEFFIFRTFYGGMREEERFETIEDLGNRFIGFRRLK